MALVFAVHIFGVFKSNSRKNNSGRKQMKKVRQKKQWSLHLGRENTHQFFREMIYIYNGFWLICKQIWHILFFFLKTKKRKIRSHNMNSLLYSQAISAFSLKKSKHVCVCVFGFSTHTISYAQFNGWISLSNCWKWCCRLLRVYTRLNIVQQKP